MKIGLVCPYSINKHGGVLEVVLALRDGLVERGHDVKIITPRPRNYGKETDTPDGVIFFGNSTDFKAPDTTPQVSSRADVEQIDSILAHENFDILHFHEPWQPLLSRQLLQRSNAINIGTFHAKIPDAVVRRALLRTVSPYLNSVLKYLHMLTAVSASGAEYVSGMTEQPITIIPNGIDMQKYQRSGGSRKADVEKSILFVGRLERRKGIKYLLQAFQVLSQDNPDVQLIIAGDGPDREKLELLAEDLRLKNVSFLGFISEELKLDLLAKADIFCSPALFGESFGIVLLEAMATDTVAVAGNNSGYIDLMEGVGALSIVNPVDTDEFARRLALLLEETKLRALWQSWAREYVKQFDYPRVVDQYEELYFEALRQHGDQ
jgi:phosphatidylinositol alpha-mannosyltransferase